MTISIKAGTAATAALLIAAASVLGSTTPAQAAAKNYKVHGTDGRLAVQAAPAVGKVVRWLKEGDTVSVVCQVNDGGTDRYDHLTSRTWDRLSGGGWVYDHFITTPAQGPDGWSPGVPHCSGSGTGSTLNPNAYPWPTEDAWVPDGHGYYRGECVSFAAWALRADGMRHTRSSDRLGDAWMWHGAYVDARPHVGDIAQWDPKHNGAGGAGHVGYVAAVYGNGTIKIDEYNWGTFHRLHIRIISAAAPSRYLHF